MNKMCKNWCHRKNDLSLMLILTFIAASACCLQPAAAQMMGQQRGGMQQMGGLNQQQTPASPLLIAQDQIKKLAQTIITDFLMTGTPLDTETIALINLDIDEVVRPHVVRFNDESNAFLLMVESLLAYYQGNRDLALEKAFLATKEHERNSVLIQNPLRLLITLSMAYGEYDSAKDYLGQLNSGAAVDPLRAAALTAQPLINQTARPPVRNPQTGTATRAGQTAPPTRTTSRFLTNMGVDQTVQANTNRNNMLGGQMNTMNRGMTGVMPGGMTGATGAVQQQAELMIDLPMDYLRYENIGDVFSTVSFRSINGSYIRFDPEKGQLLCVLLWTMPDVMAAAAATNRPGGMPGMPGMPGTVNIPIRPTPIGMGATAANQTEEVPQPTIQPAAFDFNTNSNQFKELFQWHQNAVIQGKVQFVGLNLDLIDEFNRTEVAKKTFENAWPWATCLLNDQLNQEQWNQTQTPDSALMMIVDTKGKIRYIGPVGGLIPKMILDQETEIAQPAIPQVLPDLADTTIARIAKAAAEVYTGPTEPINVHGTLAGREFNYQNASLKNEVLRISQGQGLYADLELEIFLFLRGENPANKTYTITKQDQNDIPYINLKWMPAGAFVPRTEKFTSNYQMNLEFGEIVNGKLTGKINLQLPDIQQSAVKGEFVVNIN
ncbi:MAG: hypothetical protein GY869_18185 [Planctomycetes bacterium]|nr:hypothetical protein [Planctomycetota bacterium]